MGKHFLGARSQNLPHLDFITNRPAHHRRVIIRGGKKTREGGSKACNIVNKFRLSDKKKEKRKGSDIISEF